MNLSGKIALVTGASRGIGRECALRLGAANACVAVHYRHSEKEAATVVADIERAGGQAFAIQADLGERGGVDALYVRFDEALKARFGSSQFDILVNNAGSGPRNVIENVTEAEFDETIQVDLKAPFFLIQKASPRLREGGRIINISSMSTRVAFPALAAYAPAKAGLEALTMLLAAHFGPRGITVNAVLPGATATDLHPATHDPELRARLAKSIALGRVGQPGDVADVVAFLASEASRWVTGQKLEASGGQQL